MVSIEFVKESSNRLVVGAPGPWEFGQEFMLNTQVMISDDNNGDDVWRPDTYGYVYIRCICI